MKKKGETAYICKDENSKIEGFLYLKTEGINENYDDIIPVFPKKTRLKVGTFKVESTGFRLGERFLKIILDNAQKRSVDEIYVTLFEDREELNALEKLLYRWGFERFGVKISNGKREIVLTKCVGRYLPDLSPKQNFPNINYSRNKFFLPIQPEFHTSLLPDSKLNTENRMNFLEKSAEKYALEKVYISLSFKRDMREGDLVLIYRNGTTSGMKGYESVVTTLGLINKISFDFGDKRKFFSVCENRTVFTSEKLDELWQKYKDRLLIVSFIVIKSLNKRPILKQLWDNGIVNHDSGPRPFDKISDGDFSKIIELSETELL